MIGNKMVSLEVVVALLAAICLTPNGTSGVAAQTLPDTDITNPCDPLEGDCDPSPPGDPTQYLDPLGIAVSAMHDDLLTNWFQSGVCATVEYADPEVFEYADFLSATGTFSRLDPGDGEIIPPHFDPGTIEIFTNVNAPGVDVVLFLADQSGPDGGVSQNWTLTLSVAVTQETIYIWGTLDYTRFIPLETATYAGGWIYTPGVGPEENPSSDAGFHDAVAAMFRCDPNVAGGIGLGNILSFLGSGVGMLVNYTRDLFRPYTAPTNCLGPKILDGSGQSCENEDIACANSLGDVSEYLDDLTGVSAAFKKCMKGRLGCGGSSFPRLRISCDGSDSCGPCASLPICQQLGCNGCSLGGSINWYCHDTNNPCQCANTVFHEASHSCGARDLDNGTNYDSYRIGDWFQETMADFIGCQPSSTHSTSSAIPTGLD